MFKKPLVYTCHAGLTDIVVPIFISGEHIGNFVTGQIRISSQPKENFKNGLTMFSKKDIEELKKFYYSTKVLSAKEILKITNILSFIGNYINRCKESLLYGKKSQEEDVISRVRNYVLENYKNPDLSLEKIAKDSGVSPVYLSNLFKKKTRHNLVSYITMIKINFARNLLGNTDNSIKTVCFLCGFRTFRHFCRVFKRRTGMTPLKFRENYKKIYQPPDRII